MQNLSDDDRVVSNKQVILKKYVNAGSGSFANESNLELISNKTIKMKLPNGFDGVLVKNLYLSCDTYMNACMKKTINFWVDVVSYSPGSPIRGYGVSEVLYSNDPKFMKGDFVWGMTKWEEYSLISNTDYLTRITNTDVPLSYYTGVLGINAMTACVGLYEICSASKGDFVFVSAASGAIGQLVGQFAKLMGCYVVGCVDSNEKVDFLKNKLGFDNVVNYKEELDLEIALKRCFPKGIDVCFDNVGEGDIMDAVRLNMGSNCRIAKCGFGMLSELKIEKFTGVKKSNSAKSKHSRLLCWFCATDFMNNFPKYMEIISSYISDGKMMMGYSEDFVEGLEKGPSALFDIFSGRNYEKHVVVDLAKK